MDRKTIANLGPTGPTIDKPELLFLPLHSLRDLEMPMVPLSLKSLKRSLNIFSPINGHYALPDPLRLMQNMGL
ncbi:hypothetical protein MRB53_005768 [Persea americana]|uniref:Uncharacterized protein n=1 Tax=Persea americana TaxID=3435 RepID=A0ACC2MEB9_PERAE|nr:hypothetical protein MRB53_005768 [Persea americana]